MIPLRFRVLTYAYAGQTGENSAKQEDWPGKSSGHFGMLDGEAVNLSERGIGFKSREKLGVGDEIEMYMTIPTDLTGRSPEQVRCSARVVHVESHRDVRGLTAIGAVVDGFEAIAVARSWAN